MFGRLTIARKLLLIVSVFVVIVVCVFFLGLLRSEILSGVRAYIGGEGLWSKAEKRAVLSLTKYASTHAESDYEHYLIEIAAPMGDQQARLELERPSPDMSVVARGFIEGRNSPEDVENMANLFRRFGRVGYMAHAISIWTEGDVYIDQLRSLALALRAEVTSPHPDPQRIQQITDQILNVDTQLTPLEDEFSATLGEGARWISRLLSIVTFAASALLLLIGVALSVVVLKQIHNSEEKYRNLVNAANDAILVIDAETHRILEVNSKACRLLSIPEDQLVGKLESELYAAGEEPYQLLASKPFANDHQLELRCADGGSIPVEVSASSTEIAGRPAVLGIFRDIRDRLEAAAVLQRSEERFSDLIQNLSDIITVVGVDATMLYNSPAMQRTTGFRPSELVGRSLFAFIHPEDEAPLRSALERVMLEAGTASPPEFRLRQSDGSWVWVETVINNLLKDSAVGGIVLTSRDISGRRALEEQVRQSQKMEAVGRLAGGIAHDFNNLLMVIRGYGEILLEQVSASSAARANIDTIIRTTESAAALTRQLLSFSRKHVFNPQTLDLNCLVARMSDMLRGLLGEEMELVVRLDPTAGCISADPGQIEQVVMNLVVNARDAMPQGGRIILETSHVSGDARYWGRPSSMPVGHYVALAVSDTGVGMDAETRDHIFEPFFTTKGAESGTGLGLSVVFNIVRGSGGYLRVTSEPGKGSTFRIFFPRVAPPQKPPVVEAAVRAPRGTNETILVAEDQPDLRWMICQFLQDVGYSVLEAKDGRDAISLASQYKGAIDILLTDIVMPHVRGPEVAAQLSAARPNMKVIFMSGYTEGALDMPAGDQPPETALLQKPFDLNLLAVKIRQTLEARSRN
jgi:two-component system, cell cycle sensor histidine kinase and response regulator CckA